MNHRLLLVCWKSLFFLFLLKRISKYVTRSAKRTEVTTKIIQVQEYWNDLWLLKTSAHFRLCSRTPCALIRPVYFNSELKCVNMKIWNKAATTNLWERQKRQKIKYMALVPYLQFVWRRGRVSDADQLLQWPQIVQKTDFCCWWLRGQKTILKYSPEKYTSIS